MTTRSNLARNESGSILVMTALVLVVLLGMTALTLDAAYLYDLRNSMGAAADAAAVAATKELASTSNIDDLTRFGREAASRSIDINTVTVTVHHPPQNGPYNCTNAPGSCDDYVEAIVARPAVPTFFMRMLGRTTMAVGNRAVASVKGNLPHCMVALGTDPDAVMVTGGANLQATNCQIDSHGGINATGGELNTCTAGTHVCDPGGHLRVPGAVSTITTSGSGALYGAKDPNIPLSAMPDPFERLIDPTPATPCINPTITNNLTLYPGTYCNGLSLGGKSGLNMMPGTYILLSGGFSNSSGGDVTGIGVTIYLLGGAIAIKSKVTLKAPVTGSYAGVLFWQAESNTAKGSVKSGAAGVYSGAFYLPKADIEFFAGSTSPCAPDEYRFIVAQGIKFSGSATFCNNVPGTLSGGIFGGAGLVE